MRLAELATYIPEDRIDAEEIIHAAGGTSTFARVFQRMFGIERVAATPTGTKTIEPLGRICDALADKHPENLPSALIHVRALPLQFLSGSSPAISLRQSHRFLSRIQNYYEVDQANCSGLFWALDLGRTLLETGVASSVLILAGDNLSERDLTDRYLPGLTLMGDAYCGLLLDNEVCGLQVCDVTLRCQPEFSFGYSGNSDQMARFFAAHTKLVLNALEAVSFGWEGQTSLLPHNINTLVWHRFSQETGLEGNRIRLGLLPDIGHCYTTDPFLLLDHELHTARKCASETRNDDLALISVGMGGFVGACRLQHTPGSLTQ
ncbi:3-oxoacyl-(acyl carrier protein) synthase III [Pseudovibrio sp. W64]|uniref:hypothetical protein n=1 Tax=Pseudovibrio TaxID=258255 RepID=UPI0007AE490E|nr:hypothetical protein [Pseudovibrio sp. W64]KZK81518.1 3-oxoacyl-(acyl carrier protein) synthase III [Pseudovibrio sp. W64]